MGVVTSNFIGDPGRGWHGWDLETLGFDRLCTL